MRLHVMHAHAKPFSHRLECTELIDAERDQFAITEVQFAAAEVFAIGIAGMGTDGDAMLVGQRERPGNLARPARMQPAANVRGRDERHQFGIEAGTFTEVRVEVDLHGGIVG